MPTEFFKSPVYYSSYIYRNLTKKFTVADERNSMFIRLLTVKDTSDTNLRTSYPQLSGKGCQYREEDSKNQFVFKRVHYW